MKRVMSDTAPDDKSVLWINLTDSHMYEWNDVSDSWIISDLDGLKEDVLKAHAYLDGHLKVLPNIVFIEHVSGLSTTSVTLDKYDNLLFSKFNKILVIAQITAGEGTTTMTINGNIVSSVTTEAGTGYNNYAIIGTVFPYTMIGVVDTESVNTLSSSGSIKSYILCGIY